MNEQMQEAAMLAAFKDQTAAICGDTERFRKKHARWIVGLESEVAVFSEDRTADEIGARRNALLLQSSGISCELGALQLEFRTPPIEVGESTRALRRSLEGAHGVALEAARGEGLNVLRIGSNPFFPVIGTPRTDAERYRRVPDFQNEHRRQGIATTLGLNGTRVEIGDASSVSLFQALHINLEATSVPDAVDKLNRSLMLSPYLLALSGNSRYLDLTDTGTSDHRVLVWEISHDTRTHEELRRGWGLRIGLPERYFADIGEYFDRIARYPFILYNPEAALAIGIGLAWLDARIKFLGDSAVVELRSLSTQPTIGEEIDLVLFYLGRLAYSQGNREPLLPIEFVRENRLTAILHGLAGKYWCRCQSGELVRRSGCVAVAHELALAKQGLRVMGHYDAGTLDNIAGRLLGGSPSDRLATTLKFAAKPTKRQMIDALSKLGMLIA